MKHCACIADADFDQLSLVERQFFVDGVSVGWHHDRIVVKQRNEYPIWRRRRRVGGGGSMAWAVSLTVTVTVWWRPLSTTYSPAPWVLVAIAHQRVLYGVGVRCSGLVVPAASVPSSAAPTPPVVPATVAPSLTAVNCRRTVCLTDHVCNAPIPWSFIM